jgi:hypothetical protein
MIETNLNKPKNRNEPEEGQRAHICLVLIGCFNKSTKRIPLDKTTLCLSERKTTLDRQLQHRVVNIRKEPGK